MESDALVFKTDEKALRVPFSNITSVRLDMIPPDAFEWVVVRFIGENQQPDDAAFREGGRRRSGRETGMMYLTLHRASRK